MMTVFNAAIRPASPGFSGSSVPAAARVTSCTRASRWMRYGPGSVSGRERLASASAAAARATSSSTIWPTLRRYSVAFRQSMPDLPPVPGPPQDSILINPQGRLGTRSCAPGVDQVARPAPPAHDDDVEPQGVELIVRVTAEKG